MKLRALHRYGYGNRELNPGDEFEADENEGALIVNMGQAERIDESEPEQDAGDAPKKTRKQRGYLRRDERAQD